MADGRRLLIGYNWWMCQVESFNYHLHV